MAASTKSEQGILSILGMLIGAGCVLAALVGVLNAAFHLNLALSSYGTSTALPTSYGEAAALGAVGVILIVFSLFSSFVRRKFDEAKGKPLVRVGILVGAAALVLVVGRGIQIVVLKSTYGSMLAYYATDGDLDDVKGELEKGPDKRALDRAVSRAAQYDNEKALALLLEHGADMRDATSPGTQRTCALIGRSYEFIKTALDHGVKPDSCPDSEFAVHSTVVNGKDDAEVARIVTLLIEAGFSATAVPAYDNRSLLEITTRKKWKKTADALSTRSGPQPGK